MKTSHKLSLLLCPWFILAARPQLLLAQAVEAASQPGLTVPTTTLAPTTLPATIPATMPTTFPTTQPTTGPAPFTTTTRPAPLGGTPNNADTGAITTRPDAKISINFKDARLDYVLDQLSLAAGYVIVPETTIEGRVTVTSKQPISPAEAVVLLNTVLKTNGYTIIQQGRILKIVSREKGKKSAPVNFGSDPSKIPDTDEMITQVIPVGSVDAAKLKADLSPMLSPEADVTSNAGSNTIIVTDSASSIRRMVEIIAVLDQHRTAVNDIRIFPLKYASASSAAKLITDIFKTTSTGNSQAAQPGGGGFRQMLFGGGGGGGRGGFPGGGAGGGGGAGTAGSGNDGSAIVGQVLASSDDRTNTLVVSGPTETLKVIEHVVAELDANPAAGQLYFIYNLKNSDAVNLQGVLNNFFGTGTGSTATSSRSNNQTTAYGSTSLSSSGTSGGSFGAATSNRQNRTGATGNTGMTGGGGGGNRTGGGGTSINGAIAKANSDLAGQAFVVAEPDTNSLLVSTDAKYQDRVRALIAELDRPVPQVLIKVLIAEITHSNGSDIGVEWSVLNKRPSGMGEVGGTDFGVAAAIKAAAATGGPNGFVFQMLEENASAAIRALANNNKLDILSRPYILASDNQLASIMVGQEVPIISSSNQTTNGNIINNVDYKDVGIILNVTPHINPDGLVILDVNPTISALTGETVTVQAGVNVPVIDNRQAQSRVAIKDGHTIVIGGLMQDIKIKNVDKIPLLGDIPFIGQYLFSHTNEKKVKTELLIFLTPHVASQPDDLKGMSKQEEDGTKLLKDAVEPGTYQEHMAGMERGSAHPTTQPATQPAEKKQP